MDQIVICYSFTLKYKVSVKNMLYVTASNKDKGNSEVQRNSEGYVPHQNFQR